MDPWVRQPGEWEHIPFTFTVFRSPAAFKGASRHHVRSRSSNERGTRRKNGASLSVRLLAEKLQGCRMNMKSHNRNRAKSMEGGGWDFSLPLRFPRKQVQRSVMTADPRSRQRQGDPLRTLEGTRAREITRFLSLENRDRVMTAFLAARRAPSTA